MELKTTTSRRVDPGRRDRIIEATLDLIAAEGVAGTSHRKIAALADVPLGSMTYHFASMDALLHEAFTRFATRISDRFEQRMNQASSIEAVKDAIVEMILEDTYGDRDSLVLTLELYTLSARRKEFRHLTHDWMMRSRRAFGRHFDPDVARQLDALVEGLSIHRAFEPHEDDRKLVSSAVDKLLKETVAHNMTPLPENASLYFSDVPQGLQAEKDRQA
ncbi:MULTISPECIES: TetR/AcrR family transcriptional regulator [Arthrobacter]|uniref:TetR family transcriptional regulator n=1 Tax=Arthrobacter terricola TaxID=2547396 RepID=A0A4R5KAY1_9MICC|nr:MULTISPECIES: TetR family transcriptional regulator [Arthrobacter]MBT8163141.1 TetR family transcriptional regulator [Arthrobacter sp. GN70]TDF91287.1 TetR family transcriptional regulator [Arthrobacter terricola]